MRTPWALSALLVAAVGLGSGCNSSSSSSDSGSGNGTTPGGDGAAEEGELGNGYPALQGTWQSICHRYDPPDGLESINLVITRVIEGDEADQTNEVYDLADTSCSGPPVFAANFAFRYTVGEAFTTSGGLEARPIDLELISDPQGVNEAGDQFDIFHVDGGTAYFARYASETAANRPSTLNFDVPYTRIGN